MTLSIGGYRSHVPRGELGELKAIAAQPLVGGFDQLHVTSNQELEVVEQNFFCSRINWGYASQDNLEFRKRSVSN